MAEPGFVSGLVEELTRRDVVGWIEVTSGTPPVRVSLCLDDVEVAHAWAVERVNRKVDGEARSFRFRLYDLWRFAHRTNRFSVRVGQQALPITGRGTFYRPRFDGTESLAQLQERFAAGQVFSQSGRIQLSKTVDREWQARVMRLYGDVRRAVAESFGYDPFLIYGTLLGAVREHGFIGHDLDFDAAYVSKHRNGRDAAEELVQIAFALIDRGFSVECKYTTLHIADPRVSRARIDLFHLYFDAHGSLQFPFGIAGTSEVDIRDWKGTTDISLAGAAAALPVNAEAVVELIYGANWRTPNPGFRWERDRTRRAREGILSQAMIETVHWANFYAHTSFTTGSPFFALVNARDNAPLNVVDLGCGDGRDSFAFSQAGRRVVGIDRSHIGVEHASRKAGEIDQSAAPTFVACDVADGTALRDVLTSARGSDPEAPMLFYARFFLHSLPETTQRTLLETIDTCARPGDWFAAEFRTERDEATTKVHGKHYRRFQNGPAFGRDLDDIYAFTPFVEQEGNGLSPYGDEDPYLYRVLAVRRARESD